MLLVAFQIMQITCVFSFVKISISKGKRKCQLYLPGVAVWTCVYKCKQVNIGQVLPLIWRSPLSTSMVSRTEPEPEHQIAFCPVHCVQQPHLSRNLGGIRPPVNSDARAQRHLFNETPPTHRVLKEPPFDSREPWKLAPVARNWFLGMHVPGITSELQRQHQRHLGEQRGFFSRASGWLDRNREVILVRSSGWMLTSPNVRS